jgi:hypothetical protein
MATMGFMYNATEGHRVFIVTFNAKSEILSPRCPVLLEYENFLDLSEEMGFYK